jgi:hypothetical protein
MSTILTYKFSYSCIEDLSELDDEEIIESFDDAVAWIGKYTEKSISFCEVNIDI